MHCYLNYVGTQTLAVRAPSMDRRGTSLRAATLVSAHLQIFIASVVRCGYCLHRAFQNTHPLVDGSLPLALGLHLPSRARCSEDLAHYLLVVSLQFVGLHCCTLPTCYLNIGASLFICIAVLFQPSMLGAWPSHVVLHCELDARWHLIMTPEFEDLFMHASLHLSSLPEKCSRG